MSVQELVLHRPARQRKSAVTGSWHRAGKRGRFDSWGGPIFSSSHREFDRVVQGDDDHKRATTPAAAIGAGADYLVVGRPITLADDPGRVTNAILEEMQTAFDRRRG